MRNFPHFSEHYSKMIEEEYPEAYDFLNNLDSKLFRYHILADSLANAFVWADTPQGNNYWERIHREITSAKTHWCETSVEQPTAHTDGLGNVAEVEDVVNSPQHYTSHPSGIEQVRQAAKDNVNHPTHYTKGKVECFDALESATIGKSGIEAVCVANVIKYLWRYEDKGGLESILKAKWYLDKLIECKK